MSRLKQSPEERLTLRPTWLLRHAEQLVERVGETNTPRTAHPRRAVSAAYYALFHYFCMQSAFTAVPTGWEPLCRGFQHAGVSKIAGWLRGDTCPTSVHTTVEIARRSQELRTFGRLFAILLDERELADYSHEVVVDRRTAETMVDHARSAVDSLETLSFDDESWRAFVALMLMKSDPRTYALPAKDAR